MHNHSHNPKFDFLGITSSVLCLIHCIAAPLIMVLGYGFIEPSHWHLWDFVFMAISFFAVYSVTKGHTTTLIKYGLWASFVVLFVSITVSHWLPFFEIVSWTAAGGLVFFHILNIRHCRSCMVASK